MTNEELEALIRHVAGQTIVHASPFNELISHWNTQELSQDFIKEEL